MKYPSWVDREEPEDDWDKGEVSEDDICVCGSKNVEIYGRTTFIGSYLEPPEWDSKLVCMDCGQEDLL